MSHYSFPRWFEFICLDMNYQIPHYLSTEIPCYNLRKAHNALTQSRWKDKINLYSFGWGLLSEKKKVLSTGAGVQTLKKTEISQISSAPSNKDIPLLKRINWIHFPLFLFTHSMSVYGIFFVPLKLNTFIWSVIYYFLTGFGITAGYHRLWAHRAYDASFPVRLSLMLFGSGAVEGSIRWWGRDHRIHHRYTDTEEDPYNAKRGFWYSHMGWMLFNEPNKKHGKANIDDLNKDPMIRIQHKYYPFFAFGMGFIFPTLVAGVLWDDWKGGFFWAGIIRLCFVHHATFFVNSLAHSFGAYTFADKHTPRDSFITAILTLGEGYHNFHHEFPKDYRNAIRFYQYDPTKWLIRVLAFFGLAYNLHKFPENEVQKGALQMAQKKIDRIASRIDWGQEVEDLPEFTMEQVQKSKEGNGPKFLVIGGIVHDVSKWIDKHPGGPALIEAFIGKDATHAFNGGVYNHSNAGRNMLTALRVGRIEEDKHQPLDPSLYEVEYCKPTKND